jgi:hypothetical protein
MAEETKQQQPSAPSDELLMAHVLFLDIVGYSKLPMKRQRQALQQLQQLVRDSVEFDRVENTDQLVCLPTGDGMALVFFNSTPLAPVQCALELGHALTRQPGVRAANGCAQWPCLSAHGHQSQPERRGGRDKYRPARDGLWRRWPHLAVEGGRGRA